MTDGGSVLDRDVDQWAFETGGKIRGSPAVTDDVVFVGSNDGVLYAIDRDSREPRWQFETGSLRVHDPTVVEDTVYFTSGEGVYAVAIDSGERAWEHGDRRIMKAPAVVGGELYAYAVDGNGWRFHSIDTHTGEQRWTVAENIDIEHQLKSNICVSPNLVTCASWRYLRAFDRHSGEAVWSLEPEQSVEAIAQADGTLYAGTRATDEGPNVFALEESGSYKWRTTTRNGEWITAMTAGEDAVYASGITAHDDGTKTRRVTALARTNGTELWSTVVSEESQSSVPPRAVAVRDGDVIATGDERLTVVDAEEGTIRDRVDVGDEIHTRPALNRGSVFVGSEHGMVFGLEDIL